MRSSIPSDMTSGFTEQAKTLGACLAGITSIASLKHSPSYKFYGRPKWPGKAKSVLILALAHEVSAPALDWWDNKGGGSPGNRRLEEMANTLKQWLRKEFNLNAQPLPYQVRRGGIFLKDAAALAGLGVIGKNNLLITREYGPRVRLRALFLDVDLESTGPIRFNPCEDCDMPCRQACPQHAFRDGSYRKIICHVQMRKDEASGVLLEETEEYDLPMRVVKYCRACELTCPVAR